MTTTPPVPPYPAPYSMCSREECQERQRSGEISIFESKWQPSNNNTSNNNKPKSSLSRALAGGPPQKQKPSSRRVVDPHFAMTKYRRSAAGMDSRVENARSLEALECCLSQLEYILCFQQQPPTDSSETPSLLLFPKQTLTGTVSFVEDRIRAIQVDMIVSQRADARLQYRIVKCHILILYLLGNAKKKYEPKFGRQALSAALTNYWDDKEQQHETALDDNILCLMTLQQLCQYILQQHSYDTAAASENNHSDALPSILDYYRRNTQQRKLADFPHFQWALHLVELAVMGRPQSLLRQLVECDVKLGRPSFAILCRSCLAPVVNTLRWQALEQYNISYMKGEKVHYQELARLLYFGDPEEAGQFAHVVAGLKRHDDGDKIVFKVGPMKNNKQQRND
ncbi:DNA polymerase [Seminavis robusta]|uniref:DNA polymerase n=1 Tax=Seminavis robusta TaxID=568900 RepID=A0A9N8EL27_9STRA|nr:DNA polymerase [Seminavis robusta]|eukprot:Sro1290_g259750.1 DNA polymerase (396) ;mRNA; r:5204-6391